MSNISSTFKKSYSKSAFSALPNYQNSDLNFSNDQTKMNQEISKTKKAIESNEEVDGETKEATTAASSGSYVGMFNTEIKKNNLFQPGTEIKVVREEEPEEGEVKKVEAKEATTAMSSGQYDVPFGNGGKNPLKVGGNKTIKDRIKTIRSKKFPMYGGGGKFVEPNEKCKTYPYCNQGDINALVFSENKLVKQAINNVSEKYNINKEYIKTIIFENVDIYYKNIEMSKEIENIVDTIVEKVLNEEIQNKTKQITESVSGEIDEMEEFYEIAKMRKEERMAKKVEATESEIDEDELGEDAYNYVAAKAVVDGKKTFDFGGETHDATMDLDTAKKIVGESKKSIKLTEDEIIDLIEKIVNEEKIEGTGQQEKAMKETKKNNDSYAKEVTEKMSKYVKDGSKGEFEESPTNFPKGNGDMKEMDKKAFQTSEEADEFIETYAYPGMLEVDYDIQPSEERVEKYVKGHSETGNAEIDEDGKPAGNVVPNKELGEKLMKKYKDGKYQEDKEVVSYNRVPQPVIERPYDEAGEKKIKPAKITKESIEGKKINEDISRMKNLMSHLYKTQ
jgi:hypothetical protein